MADYRSIQIEEESQTEDEEIEENLIPERSNLPVHSFPIHESEEDDSDNYDNDYNDDSDSDDYEYDFEDEVDLNPDIILPVDLNLNQSEDEDGSNSDSDYDDDDEDDYDDDDEDDEDDYDDDDEDDDDDESYEEDGEVEEMDRDVSSSINRDRSVVMENSNVFDGRKEEAVNRCETDGSICPICFEAWTSGGKHQISCLPCGHIFGLSCIKKWLLQRRSSGKCPQCNQYSTIKDVRVLYTSRLCIADEELHERVRSLEAKCAYLEGKATPLTHDELINQICSNPTLVERLATALAGLH